MDFFMEDTTIIMEDTTIIMVATAEATAATVEAMAEATVTEDILAMVMVDTDTVTIIISKKEIDPRQKRYL
jgi:hypothetical protein